MYPHHYYPIYSYHSRPRRFLWFVLGGMAATLWLKGRERGGRSIDAPRGWWHECRRMTTGEPHEEGAWTEERQRFSRIGAQASETIADVSETTLDSILTTVEALKAKLAEQRNTRQRIEDERKKEEEFHRV